MRPDPQPEGREANAGPGAPSRDPGRTATISVHSAILVVPGMSVVTFLSLPLLAILLKVVPQAGLWETLREPLVTQALRLSLITSLSSLLLAILFGTPVAYLLARYRFRGARVVETLIDLPMVLPPTVAGVALLMALGRRGLLGPWLAVAGVQIGFSTTAVILAQSFVCLPFYIRAAQAGFRSVDPELERVAHTLGVSALRTFWRVTVPLALPALLSGGVMAWARALGEFGATIMFAGNLRGRTQTMPLAIYLAMESDLPAALALSTLLIVVSFSVLLGVRALVRRGALATYA